MVREAKVCFAAHMVDGVQQERSGTARGVEYYVAGLLGQSFQGEGYQRWSDAVQSEVDEGDSEAIRVKEVAMRVAGARELVGAGIAPDGGAGLGGEERGDGGVALDESDLEGVISRWDDTRGNRRGRGGGGPGHRNGHGSVFLHDGGDVDFGPDGASVVEPVMEIPSGSVGSEADVWAVGSGGLGGC